MAKYLPYGRLYAGANRITTCAHYNKGDVYKRQIYKEASRLMTLVQDIINLSQLDEGGGGAEKQPVELLALAQEISSCLLYTSRCV